MKIGTLPHENLGRIEDADLAEVVTKLQALMLNKEASQQSFAMISRLSLFDYISYDKLMKHWNLQGVAKLKCKFANLKTLLTEKDHFAVQTRNLLRRADRHTAIHIAAEYDAAL